MKSMTISKKAKVDSKKKTKHLAKAKPARKAHKAVSAKPIKKPGQAKKTAAVKTYKKTVSKVKIRIKRNSRTGRSSENPSQRNKAGPAGYKTGIKTRTD